MVRVRLVHGVIAGLPLAAVTSTGCAVPAQGGVGEGEAAFTTGEPGTGVMSLTAIWTGDARYMMSAKNSTDEFVRAKETMSFALPAEYLWSTLHASETFPSSDDARLKKLSADVEVRFFRGGAQYATAHVSTTSWTGTSYGLTAATSTFVVDPHAEAMHFVITAKDATAPRQATAIPDEQILSLGVFGGNVPAKTALFDTLGGTLRSRVIEGGRPVAGADLVVGYADWRAQTLTDASSFDRSIGTEMTSSRFGMVEVPIFGTVEYDIDMGYAIDGAPQPDQRLTPDASSPLVAGFGRTAFEGRIAIPAGAAKLETYFHVRAYLKVDYSLFQDVVSRKYADGERVLLRDKWDNDPGPTTATNWPFLLESR